MVLWLSLWPGKTRDRWFDSGFPGLLGQTLNRVSMTIFQDKLVLTRIYFDEAVCVTFKGASLQTKNCTFTRIGSISFAFF